MPACTVFNTEVLAGKIPDLIVGNIDAADPAVCRQGHAGEPLAVSSTPTPAIRATNS